MTLICKDCSETILDEGGKTVVGLCDTCREARDEAARERENMEIEGMTK